MIWTLSARPKFLFPTSKEEHIDLIFERTGERRYAIHAIRPGMARATMDPAPGFDIYLPHDLMHMVVEAKLGLKRAVFGQLADGGLAGTFRLQRDESLGKREAARQRRRADSRDDSLLKEGREDSETSERATYICWFEWLSRSQDAALRKRANSMAENASHVRDTAPASELEALGPDVIDGICLHLNELSSRWSGLEPGQSMTVRWPDLTLL